MTAIYKRELKSYFCTMTGWVFLAVNIFITGLYFVSMNLTFGEPDLSYTLNSVIFMFIFSIPVLTMKAISEERKQKTDQLILTSSVSVWRIVCAKYLAMLTVFIIPVLIFSCFPVIMSAFGTAAVTESYCSLAGFFLLGAACIAIGLFISSLTESRVVSAILTIAVLFVTYQVDGIAYMISSEGNLFTAFLEIFNITGNFSKMSGGIFDLSSLVYFLSVIYVCLFLTVQMIRKRSYTVSRKGIAPGAYSIGMTVTAVAAVVFVNLSFAALPDRYTQIDMTSNRLYSLTDASESALKSLDKDIVIYVLNSEDDEDTLLGNTLDKMQEASSHITVEYRDPVEYPDFYKDYTDGNISFNSLIITCGDKYRVIDFSDCYTTSFDYSTFQQTAEGYDGEGQLISAIDYVTRDSLDRIYLLTGHGERSLGKEFSEALTKANIETEELNLLTVDSVPDDAKAIYIAAAHTDLTEDEASKLDAYIKKGGKLIVEAAYCGSYENEMPYFSRVLAEFGVSIEDGQILEKDRSKYFERESDRLPDVMSDELTEGVYGESYVFMPGAQSIAENASSEDTEVTALVKTGDSSVLADSEGNEIKEGSFNTAIHSVKTLEGTEAELILYACESVFTDEINAMTTGGNLRLFSNAASGFTGSESNISIPVKNLSGDYLMVSQGTRFEITVFLTVLIPVLLLASGFVIMYKRRKR